MPYEYISLMNIFSSKKRRFVESVPGVGLPGLVGIGPDVGRGAGKGGSAQEVWHRGDPIVDQVGAKLGNQAATRMPCRRSML
jgi:hypothetical protein